VGGVMIMDDIQVKGILRNSYFVYTY